MSAVSERVHQALEPAVSRAGLDLEAVEVQPAGRRRLLRVIIDRDGGVTLDDVAGLSSQLAAVLDESGAMGDQPYVLEVTSPGVDRLLTAPRHWRRATGHLVEVVRTDGSKTTGRVARSDDSSATLINDRDEHETVVFLDVAKASVQVEFRRESPAKGE